MSFSCKIVKTTSSGQSIAPLGYTIVIRMLECGNTQGKVMEKVHQFSSPVYVKFDTNSFYLNQKEEIQVKIKAISDNQVNEMRNELYAISGVLHINISKN